MHTRKPLIATVAVFGALVVLLAGAMVTMETRWFSNFLSERLSNSFEREIQWQGPLHIDWSLKPTIRVEQLRVDNPQWAEHDNFAEANSITAKVALPKLFQGLIAVEHLQMQQPAAHLRRSEEHGSNWDFLISEDEEDKEPLLKPKLGEILVSGGEFTFTDPQHDTAISATANSPDGTALRIRGDGELLGEPLQLRVTGDPIQEAVRHEVDITEGEPEGAYQLRGNLDWKQHSLQLAGTTSSLTALENLQFALHVQGPDTQDVAQLWNPQAPSAPYETRLEVTHENGDWLMRNLNGHIGDSTFTAEAAYRTGGARPKIIADMRVSAIYLDALLPDNLQEKTETPALAAAEQPWRERMYELLAPLRSYDADVSLRLGHLQKAETVVQNLHAEAQLSDGELRLQTFEFDTGDGQVAVAGSLDAAQQPITGRAELDLQEVDLGQALAGFDLNNLGNIDGQITTELSQQNLLLNSDVRYWDGNETDIEARTTSTAEPESAGKAFQMNADGRVNGQSLQFQFSGGPLLELDSAGQPYPLNAELTFADTEFSATGTVTQPSQPGDADIEVHGEGPDPAQLQQLTGVEIPQMPPYQIDGHLLREDDSWYLRDIRAELGESDLRGNLRWQKTDQQPLMVWADLRSQRLDIDQLTNVGSDEDTDENQAQDAAEAEQEQVLPDEQVAGSVLQTFNARIKYTADNVTASGVPLDDIQLTLNLDQGELEVAPLSFGVGGGTVRTDLYADGRVSPISGHTELEIANVSINEVLSPLELANDSFGRLGGQGQFNFSGRSVAQALANLQGEMHLAMTDGRLDATLVEALGLDAGEIVFTLFGDESDPVDIQCAYVKLDANNGVVNIQPLTIATADSNIVGDGEVNFEDESFELVVEAKPKDFSVLSSSSPLRVHGTFSEPQIDVVSDELLARGALAAIGAAVFPPAALLPLVELGTEEGQSGCEQDVKSAEVATQ